MRYTLAPFIGDGSSGNPYRPQVDDFGLIDFRGDPTHQEGWSIVRSPNIPSGAIVLGDDLDESLSSPLLNNLESRLGVTLEARSLRATLVELLLRHATPPGDRSKWNRLIADANGRHRIILGELIYDAPGIQNLVVTDDFNRADEALEASASWSVSDANFAIVSNQMVLTVLQDRVTGWWDDDTFGPNMYTQAECVNIGSLAGLIARYDGGDLDIDGNLYRFHWTESGSDWRLDKVVDGTATILANTGNRQPGTWRLEVDGSTITGFNNELFRIGATDSDIVVAGFAGFFASRFQSDDVSIWDDFEAGDLPPSPYEGGNLMLGVG